jgi:hypothetical protein
MPINYPDIASDGLEPLDLKDSNAQSDCEGGGKDTDSISSSILDSLNAAFDSNPDLEEFGLILSERGSNIHEFVAQATDSAEKGREFGNGSVIVIGNKIALAFWSLPHILREASRVLQTLSKEPSCDAPYPAPFVLFLHIVTFPSHFSHAS